MADYITLADIQVFRADVDVNKTNALIASARAQAIEAVPAILTATFIADVNKMEVLKGILRGAVLRWYDNGDQGISAKQQAAGPFSISETIDTRQPGGYSLWPSEIERISRAAFGNQASGKAFAINTVPGTGASPHADICSINFGATYCSCGAVLTNNLYALYETVSY